MNGRVFKYIMALVAFGVASTAQAQAQQQPVELQGDVKLEKTVTENGASKQVLVDPAVVVPGDRLIFSTTYRNNGTSAVKNFIVTNPLPAGVALSELSSAPVEVSVDGGKGWGALASLKVDDGKGGVRAAIPADVTHVRWTLPVLQPRATGTLSFHAVVR